MTEDFVEVPFAVSDRKEADGGRLDRFLSLRLHGYSRAQVQRLIRGGCVLRSGRVLKASSRVRLHDTVVLRFPKREEEPARYGALPVLFEDDEMLAVNKPGDLISHPTDRIFLNSATTVLTAQFPGMTLHLVHRLDRETSGVLLLAKDRKSARFLAEEFAARRASKEYLAWVKGPWRFERLLIDKPIGRAGGEIKVRQTVGGAGAVSSQTEVQFVREAGDRTLVRAYPKTGRLHQIRVHLSSMGHPVIGDKLYYGDGAEYLKAVRKELKISDLERLGAGRQLLHAAKLNVRRPSGSAVTIEAPLPADFAL